MKICSTCKIKKPLSDFFKKKESKDGHQSWCKHCKNKKNQADCKSRREKNREKLYAKMGHACQRCGFIPECHAAFDLHHLDPTEKERNITDLMLGSWEKLEKELNKCVLLCANCHRTVHYNLNKQKLDTSKA